jgi:hypothetical protein
VLALPGTDDSVRGLTVDGWIVADEAARLTDNLIAALRPMRARKPQARFAMLSTAWSRSDPFWQAWDDQDPAWIRIKATADMPGTDLDPGFLDQERRTLGEDAYKREYLGIPLGGGASPFSWELYADATSHHAPLAPLGDAFLPAPERSGVPAQSLARFGQRARHIAGDLMATGGVEEFLCRLGQNCKAVVADRSVPAEKAAHHSAEQGKATSASAASIIAAAASVPVWWRLGWLSGSSAPL